MKRRTAWAQRLPAVALLFALGVADAAAHATPMLYEPAAASVVEKIPPRIRIQFSEHIEAKASSIAIFSPDGSRADLKDSRLDPADKRVLTVGVRDAGEGQYTVSWQVVSEDDGHFTKGGFSFGVGKDTLPLKSFTDPIQVEHSSTVPQAGAIGTELLGQSLLLAAMIAVALLWRSLPKRGITDAQQAAFERSCNVVVGLGVTLVAAGVLAFLVLKTLDLEGSRTTAFAATFQTFIGTVDGRFAVYRLILGLAFGVWFAATRKLIFGAPRFSMHEVVLALLAALMLLDRARVSHAAAAHFHPGFSILMNAVHLLAKEFWVGGLLALSLILMPILNRMGHASRLALTLSTMSKYISIALGAAGVTGAYIVWLHLKSAEYILTTPWGMRFLMLSAFAAVLLSLRIHNQLFAERCALWACTQSLQYSIPFEMCVGVALLFVTSQLIVTTPPYPSERYALEKHQSSQGARISLSVHPIEQKQFLLTVTDEKNGEAVPVTEAIVTLENTDKNIGPLVADTDERFPGGFTFPRSSLSVPGHWTVDVTARRSGSYDAAVSMALDYPVELDAGRIGPDVRVPGLFEGVLTFVAASTVLFSSFLYVFAQKQIARCNEAGEIRGGSQPGFSVARSLIVMVPATAMVSLAIWALDGFFLKSRFERLCENNGGHWIQSVPMRAGIPLNQETMAVCSTPANDFHFAEMREYEHYLQQPARDKEHHEQHDRR